MKEYLEMVKGERTSKAAKIIPLSQLAAKAKQYARKPPKELTLVNKLGNTVSETGKYVAMALANTELLPKWSIEEILNLFGDDNAFNKEDLKFVKPNGDKGLSEAQKIAKAKEIWKNVLSSQGEKQTDVTKQLESGARKGKFVFASEFLKSSSHIETAILQAINALKQISQSDADYKFDESQILDFKVEGKESTGKFMSNLISKVVTELQKALNKYEFDKRIEDTLWTITDNISEANRNILWPESDHDITSVAALEKYFRTLRSSDEMKRGEKVLGQLNKGIGYKKKGKMEAKKEENFDRDFLKLMYNATEETRGVPTEYEEFDQKVNSLAKQYLKENPWLKSYLIKEHDLGADATDADVKDELVSQLAFHISKLRQKLGRKHRLL